MRPAAWVLLVSAGGACGGDDTTTLGGQGGAGSSAAGTTTGASGGGGGSAPTSEDVEVAWSVRWGGKKTDERVTQILVDEDDTVVVAGSIGELDATEPPLLATDELDVLLARWSGDGELLAARTLGGFGVDSPRALLAGASGELLLTGTFSEAIDEISPPLVAFGGQATFVAALDDDLEPAWGVAILGAAVGAGQLSMAAPAGGGAVVAGSFDGALAIGEQTLVASGAADAFVARLDASGSLAWVRQLGGEGATHLEATAATAASDDVIVTLQLSGSLELDGVEIARSVERRPVVLRLLPDGTVASARVLGGEGAAAVTRVAPRPGGLLLAVSTGTPFETAGAVVEAAGEGDVTLVWADAAGAPLSGASFGDDRAQSIGGLWVGSDGTALVAGAFQGRLEAESASLRAPGGRPDGFVLEVSPGGRVQRALVASDGPLEEGERPGSQSVAGIARFASGDLAVAGGFTRDVQIGADVHAAKGAVDAFLARVRRW